MKNLLMATFRVFDGTRRTTRCFSALATIAALVACATIDIDISLKDLRAKIRIEPNGSKKLDTTGSLPPGKCVQYDFKDAQGNSVGSETSTVPGTVPVPSNATDKSEKVVDCPNSQAHYGGGGHDRLSPSIKPRRVDITGSPVSPNFVNGGRYNNATYHFVVQVEPGVDPFPFIEPILLGGPGTPVPANVEIISFTQIVPDVFGARLIAADTDTFDAFALEWNGQAEYAVLGGSDNIVQYDAAHQWNVVEVLIPAWDINEGLFAVNKAKTIRKTNGERAARNVTMETTVVQM